MNIGLFGGSFDPVHRGHENLLLNFMQKLSLDKIFVIPVFVSPFKIDRPPIATPQDRVAMLKLAFEGMSKVEILTDEIDRKEISYTIDTVREIVAKFPEDKFFLLLSEEMIPLFPLWKNFEEIKKLVRPEFGKVTLPISSTAIRERLKNCESCKEYLSAKVLEYIEKYALYS